MMKKIIISGLIISTSILTSCVAQTYQEPGGVTKTYVYAGSDGQFSNRVDYLGYGLGGQGLGGYSMGGFGLVGYGAQRPDSF